MDMTPKDQLSTIPDLRHRLRQLRWFSKAFRSNADLIEAHFGFRFRIDERRLNQVFFDWLAAISAQDRTATLDRADYIVYLAGLALREMISTQPAALASDAGATQAEDQKTVEIIRFWPEGFLFTNFCLCAVAAVHEQEFGEHRSLAEVASDLKTWWSFRENAAEDSNISIAFFDYFLGLDPNWQFPAIAYERSAIKKILAEREGGPQRLR